MNQTINILKELSKKSLIYKKVLNKSDILHYKMKKMFQETTINIFKTLFAEGRNVHLSGPGGVGKTYITNELIELITKCNQVVDIVGKKYSQPPICYHVTSTTGCSAINIKFGKTLHRFAGLGLMKEDVKVLVQRALKSRTIRERWQSCEFLIIDECSMLGCELLTKINTIAQVLRRNNEPMGGIRVMFVGDFFQLPPVNDDFCFMSPVWDKLNFQWYVLSEPKRFDSVNYFDLLQRARYGNCTKKDYKLLRTRVEAYKTWLKREKHPNEIQPTILYSTRVSVDDYNLDKLAKLRDQGPRHSYNAVDTAYNLSSDVNTATEEVTETPSTLTPEESILLDDIAPQKVVLRKGAQVMLTRNLDVDRGLVNGSRGVVRDILPTGEIFVDFINNKNVQILKYRHEYYIGRRKYVRDQIPLMLAWAVTIHKSQSATIDMVIVDLTNIFSPGQAYVALSRVKNLESLYLTGIVDKVIYASPEVLEFYEKQVK